MQVIALKFNKATLGNEKYEKLKEQLAEAIRAAMAKGEIKGAISMELDTKSEQEHAFLLQYDATEEINPNLARNSLSRQTGVNPNSDIQSSIPEFLKTDAFQAIPDDGQSHTFEAFQITSSKKRGRELLKDSLWGGRFLTTGINKLFGNNGIIINLSSQSKILFGVTNIEKAKTVVEAIHSAKIGEALRKEQKKSNPDRTKSGVAKKLPGIDKPSAVNERVQITAQRLTL